MQASTTPKRSAGNWLDSTMIAGRPARWYLSGWRVSLIFLVIAVLLPQIFSLLEGIAPDTFVQTVMLNAFISANIYVMLAMGLNIVVGYAGLLDLGYVAFFVLGSYTAAVGTSGFFYDANRKVVHLGFATSAWPLLIVGAIVAAVFGVLLGAPTLRLRGDYLAIVTLGFGEIIPIFFRNVPFFNGAFGMTTLPPAPVETPVGTFDFASYIDKTPFYYLTLVFVVLAILLSYSMRSSSLGRAWIAIREDELAASASGVNLVRVKLMAFAMGAAIGGVAGVINAVNVSNVAPESFNFNISITILVMIVLGGISSLPGVITGALILGLIDSYFLKRITDFLHTNPAVASDGSPLHFLAAYDFNNAKFLIYGLILVGMILLRPQGLIPDSRRKRELKGEGVAAEGLSVIGEIEREETDSPIASPRTQE